MTGLVGTAARLRLALLRGALRSGPGAAFRRFGLFFGAVLGAGLAVLALVGLTAARGHGRLPEDLAVLLFTALLVGWVVLPILTFGTDDLLDPTRLALLPLTGRQMTVVMGVGALVGVAPVATLVAALGLLPATVVGPGSFLVALAAAVLEVALCVSTSRAVTVLLSRVLRSRRGRDLGVVLAALVGLSFQLVNVLFQAGLRGGGPGEGLIHSLAAPVRWGPPGLLATAVARPLPEAAASLLAVAAVIGALLVVWERGVRRSLESVDESGPRIRRRTRLAPAFVPLPAGRVGAIAAKDLRYLTREPRRMTSAVIGVLVPVLAFAVGPAVLRGSRPSAGLVFVVCGIGLIGGLNSANRFGLDGTATWLLIGTATDPKDARRDLLGGDLATGVMIVPLTLAVGLLLAVITGGWSYLPSAWGIALALFAVALGCSDLLSVLSPYPVPPTQNAFGGGGGGQGVAAGMSTLLALVAAPVLCLPLLGLLIPGLIWHAPVWGIVLLVVGPVYGGVIGTVLRRAAARRWSVRAPEVLQVLSAQRG